MLRLLKAERPSATMDLTKRPLATGLSGQIPETVPRQDLFGVRKRSEILSRAVTTDKSDVKRTDRLYSQPRLYSLLPYVC